MIAISPDRPEKLEESIGKHDIGYQLLSDSDATAAKAFGIAFRLDDETFELYKRYGMDLAAASGEDHQILPVPSVFIINVEGTIQFQYVNPDHRIRIHSDILLAAVKALHKP